MDHKARKPTRRKATARSQRKRAERSPPSPGAIAILKADHREIEGWFGEFLATRSVERKMDLARKICTALTVHTMIEEEIFYPAFLEATGERSMHHEAKIEHLAAKRLIAEIEVSTPDDDYFKARVEVLSEMIKHHVKEEEQPSGMFAKARRSSMKLDELGTLLKRRKEELMKSGGPPRGGDGEVVSGAWLLT